MKLTFKDIAPLTVGAVRIWEEDGNTHFSKCTQKQLDAWRALNDFLGDNAAATTGVRIDLHTNSSSFAFTAPKGNKFEIYINDVMHYYIPREALAEDRFAVSIDTSVTETNRITLILSAHGEASVLSSIELDDGATFTPHSFDRKLLFIGDSITQGWDSGYDSLSYAYRVSRFFNADSVIHGVGGGYFHPSIFDELTDFDPDVVIVAFGTNDWGVCSSRDELVTNCNAFLDLLCAHYAGKTLIGLSPIWRDVKGEVRNAGSFSQVCECVKECISAHGMTLIDGMSLTPHNSDFFADLTLHPNALGFGIYAENLARAMCDIIK